MKISLVLIGLLILVGLFWVFNGYAPILSPVTVWSKGIALVFILVLQMVLAYDFDTALFGFTFGMMGMAYIMTLLVGFDWVLFLIYLVPITLLLVGQVVDRNRYGTYMGPATATFLMFWIISTIVLLLTF